MTHRFLPFKMCTTPTPRKYAKKLLYAKSDHCLSSNLKINESEKLVEPFCDSNINNESSYPEKK